MQVEEVTQEQLDLLVNIATVTPLFSVAIIPEGHGNYEAKGKLYQEVADNVRVLENLGFVEDISSKEGNHRKIVERAEEASGYKYYVYVISKLGILMFSAYEDEVKKEAKYKNSIN